MYNFINAQEMQQKFPGTFEAPTYAELRNINIGNSVKVCSNDERFWVAVINVDGDIVTGKVDNDLICDQPFKCGDTIRFNLNNIYSIFK